MKNSIALCTYNGEKFLKEQLESFLNQTKLPDEVVICDDLSGDSTAEILKIFEENSPFSVRFEINQKQLGVVKNFEKAISLCKNEIVFLSDQDDIWMPEKLEIITHQFEQNENLGMIFTDAELIDETSKKLGKTLFSQTFRNADKNTELFDLCLNKNVVTGATMAFRAKYCDDFLPIPKNIPNIIHDGWIALVISAVAETQRLEKPLIKYRQHNQQQLGLFGKTFADSIEKLNKEIIVLRNFPDYFSNEMILNKLAEKEYLINEIIAEKTEQIKHYEMRMNLSRNHLKRFLSIFAEIKSGRYSKFSSGLKSAAKDILRGKSNFK